MLRALLIVLATLLASSAMADDLSLGDPGWTQTGKASYYSSRLHGRRTASGEPYDETDLTAAHPQLPFGTLIEVTNLYNNRSVVLRINDRGPFVRGRVIDLSKSAFTRIGDLRAGLLRVALEIERPAPGR